MNCPNPSVGAIYAVSVLLVIVSLFLFVYVIINLRNARHTEKIKEELRRRTQELHVALRGP